MLGIARPCSDICLLLCCPAGLAASVARLLLAFAFYDFNVGHTFAITQALAGPRDLGPAVRKM